MFLACISSGTQGTERQLSVIRMPFAKQELPGKSVPVRGEPSVYGIGHSPPDLKFEVEGQVISVQELIGEFDRCSVVSKGPTSSRTIVQHTQRCRIRDSTRTSLNKSVNARARRSPASGQLTLLAPRLP